ncbi:jg11678 [Pararge aegeria aegeria]|uniref:Jg11678 protein n=1 Tax=Pararge aegeria aegeria TaxID=348720 RepID=A0A8S4RZT9_9NEOP|nr:jg11678 [Pararge aegeria aegeria]
MDAANGPSLRLRGGVNNNCENKKHELNLCTSAMSPETQRLLPPVTETIMTKPFPIRGVQISSRYFASPLKQVRFQLLKTRKVRGAGIPTWLSESEANVLLKKALAA